MEATLNETATWNGIDVVLSNGAVRPHVEIVTTIAAPVISEEVSSRPTPAALRAAAIGETPGSGHLAVGSITTRVGLNKLPDRPIRPTPHELKESIDPDQNNLEHWLKLPRPVGAYMLGGNALRRIGALARLVLDRARMGEGGYVTYQEMADSLLPADAPGHARNLLIRALNNATDSLQNRLDLTNLGLAVTRSRRPELGNLPSFRLHGYTDGFAFKEASPADSKNSINPITRRKLVPPPVEIVLPPVEKTNGRPKQNLSIEVNGKIVRGLRQSEHTILLEALARLTDTTPRGIYERLQGKGVNIAYHTVEVGLARLTRNKALQAAEVGLYYRSSMVK